MLGIDVGGTKVCVGLVSEQGKIVSSIRYPQRYCPIEGWTSELISHIDSFLLQKGRNMDIEAIGIGSRGHVDYREQKLLRSTIMNVSPGFDLCRILKEYFHVPVYIDNDVKSAACGEIMFGAGKKYQNFACYNIGTGIAVSVVLEGKMVRGQHNNAGEICGDLLWNGMDNKEIKGLEELASGKGMENETKFLLKSFPRSVLNRQDRTITTRNILLAYRDESDELASFVVNRALYVLAASIINIQHLLDLEAFVLLGGVVSDAWFLEQLEKEIKRLSHEIKDESAPRIKASSIGPGDIGLVGAASVAFYGMEQNRS